MKFLIQRVSSASVTVDGEVTGSIDKGFFVLVGVSAEDTKTEADKLLRKLLGLRIFSDAEGKTNLSLSDVGGSILLVSQFTLYADCKKGNRPSFIRSGPADHAEELYNYVVDRCREWADGINSGAMNSVMDESSAGIGDDTMSVKRCRVETGIFGAHMICSIVNDGPFTIDLDSSEL